MKKFIGFLFLGLLLLSFLIVSNNKKDNVLYKESHVYKDKNTLSMMLETEAGSGEYSLETRSSWPTEGYVFNEELSKCENGSTLSWDDENNVVYFEGTSKDKCYVYFDKLPPKLSEWVKEQYAAQTSENETIYYHDSSLENGAGDNSYRYSGSNYKLTSKAENEGFIEIQSLYIDITDALINFYCNGEKVYAGHPCSSSYTYTLQYDTSSVEYNSYNQVLKQALSDGYIEENVNNYVCFGSDEETCSNDNLYRIVGVFDDEVKLIKADYVTSEMLGTDTDEYSGTYSNPFGGDPISYYQGEDSYLTNIVGYSWNKANYQASYDATGYYNDWSYSELNKTHLNKNYINYLNNIDTKWTNMIDTTMWKVGGNTNDNMVYSNAQTAYTNEITSPSNQVTSTYESKIGLMYVSDYAYAATRWAWTMNLVEYYRRTIPEKNWMYMGLYEWTMTRNASDSSVYCVVENGYVGGNPYNFSFAVRPVFYLLSSVTYVSGNGTKDLPIRIKAG